MILILTPYNLNPRHPRIDSLVSVFQNHNVKYKLINLSKFNKIIYIINYICFNYFDIYAVIKSLSCIFKYRKEIEIVYIQDFKYLPISVVAKMFKKIVIYETLDNNIELTFYNLCKKIKFLKKFRFLKKIFSHFEFFLVRYFCNQIIVNSIALENLFFEFNQKNNLIYYTSPLEKIYNHKRSNSKFAFLYLGLFSIDKGAKEILDIIEKFNLNLYLFGQIDFKDKNIWNKFQNFIDDKKIFYTPSLASEELSKHLEPLMDYYNLVGISLIKSVHKSYETQEANKDIDYLAIGVPLVGNKREKTKEKIEKGCGVFFNSSKDIHKLVSDCNFYSHLSDKCRDYYNKNYSYTQYEKKIIRVLKNAR